MDTRNQYVMSKKNKKIITASILLKLIVSFCSLKQILEEITSCVRKHTDETTLHFGHITNINYQIAPTDQMASSCHLTQLELVEKRHNSPLTLSFSPLSL